MAKNIYLPYKKFNKVDNIGSIDIELDNLESDLADMYLRLTNELKYNIESSVIGSSNIKLIGDTNLINMTNSEIYNRTIVIKSNGMLGYNNSAGCGTIKYSITIDGTLYQTGTVGSIVSIGSIQSINALKVIDIPSGSINISIYHTGVGSGSALSGAGNIVTTVEVFSKR